MPSGASSSRQCTAGLKAVKGSHDIANFRRFIRIPRLALHSLLQTSTRYRDEYPEITSYSASALYRLYNGLPSSGGKVN